MISQLEMHLRGPTIESNTRTTTYSIFAQFRIFHAVCYVCYAFPFVYKLYIKAQ
jgi:hypothetical protein